MSVKPILFSTDMVRAILEGRKAVTRRVIKQQEPDWEFCHMENDPYMTRIDRNGKEYPSQETGLWATFEWGAEFPLVKVPYRPGDILYVRETWNYGYCDTTDFELQYNETFFEELKPGSMKDSFLFPRYFYRTEDLDGIVGMKWRPSIHMPREAARIFLRVTDMRVERLQSILPCDIQREGCPYIYSGFDEEQAPDWYGWMKSVWDSTIKKADCALYGWEANPWVWAIGFERCEKPEGD